MIDYFKQIVVGQFEAALAMMKACIDACPAERWDDTIANVTFRQVAYHTLFCTDMYLSADENAFSLRELHARGGDERVEKVSPGLSQEETLSYVSICREKVLESLDAETSASLAGPSGFSWRTDISRGELHIYNIRHIQHHTGQLSAHLRRVKAVGEERQSLPWVATGWR
jgi:hypothetical protein